jgi:hypothetical protein
MENLTICRIIEDKNPITNGKFHVICQTEDGQIIDGFGNTVDAAKIDAQQKAEKKAEQKVKVKRG